MRPALLITALLLTPGCSEYDLKRSDDALADTGQGPAGPGGGPGGGGPGGGGQPDYECAISGRICDPSGGSYVSGALVYVAVDSDGDGVEDYRAETTTDADGYFNLEGVPCQEPVTVVVEKGSFNVGYDLTVQGGTYELPEDVCLTGDDVDIAVITGLYDDIGGILDRLALDYREYSGLSTAHVAFLSDVDLMLQYDIIFMNCGMNDNWIDSATLIGENIRTYVELGGSIYASDWAHYTAEVAFPEAIDFYGNDASYQAARQGRAGNVTAQVLDDDMEAVLGTSVAQIYYDLPEWGVIEGAGTGRVLIQGDVSLLGSGGVSAAPLAVEIDSGDGRFIYTTFHNERQATVDMELLLTEIILSL